MIKSLSNERQTKYEIPRHLKIQELIFYCLCYITRSFLKFLKFFLFLHVILHSMFFPGGDIKQMIQKHILVKYFDINVKKVFLKK